MTLGGLALAVGILVDEATVAIENIHTHLARGAPVARGVLDASGEVVVPRLLAMLSVVAVFVPSFFMTGVSRSLFVPLSLAVGFAMIASFLLSSSLVPVLSVWLLRRHRIGDARRPGRSSVCAPASTTALRRLAPAARLLVIAAYAVVTVGDRGAWSGSRSAARFSRRRRPASSSCGSGRRPGTKFESTERLAGDVLDEINRAAGPATWTITLGYVGVQPSSYPINTIFLWTGGSHEGVLQVALRPEARDSSFADLRGDACASDSDERFPDAQFSFEPGDIVSRIMNFGAPTPVEVAVAGPDFAATPGVRAKVRDELGAGSRRCATCSTNRRSIIPAIAGQREPAAGGATRRHASSRSGGRSPRRPRRAGSSRRTTGPIRARASRFRCRSRCRSRR